MKNLILMVSLVAFVFTGCKKKEDPAPSNNNNNNTATGVLVCKVNNQDWQSDPASKMTEFVGVPVKSTWAYKTVDTMEITGIRIKGNDTSAISFYFVAKSGVVGTYNLSGTEYNGVYFAGTSLEDILVAAFGYTTTTTLEITKYDAAAKKISGKFSITMTATDPSLQNVTITNGTFTDIVID